MSDRLHRISIDAPREPVHDLIAPPTASPAGGPADRSGPTASSGAGSASASVTPTHLPPSWTGRHCCSPPTGGQRGGTPVLERTIDMAKFIYLYRGPATPTSDITPEQGAERMAAFRAWMEKVGTALVDVGCPFGPSTSVRDDGTEGTASDLIGYSIVEADDLAAAKALTDGLPLLSDSDGQCDVEIFELLAM
jgi:hypothetical protein